MGSALCGPGFYDRAPIPPAGHVELRCSNCRGWHTIPQVQFLVEADVAADGTTIVWYCPDHRIRTGQTDVG